ncbi:hypothetical protein ACIBEA_30130 [Streptomyces sp. NPDC051555]|uniref:hypothetical protein n=1 Tax=Streptomyces sp. NPDC051555 TaxID=3365657 RepID=UPI00378FB1BD
MTDWDAHDARTSRLTPRQEAALIRAVAKERARGCRTHVRGCACNACYVRRIDATLRALRKAAADAKAVTS